MYVGVPCCAQHWAPLVYGASARPGHTPALTAAFEFFTQAQSEHFERHVAEPYRPALSARCSCCIRRVVQRPTLYGITISPEPGEPT